MIKQLQERIRYTIKVILGFERVQRARYRKRSRFHGTKDEFNATFDGIEKVAILFDRYQEHIYYLEACHEMGISYEVINPELPGWLNVLNNASCSHVFFWPSIDSSISKLLCDERASLIADSGRFFIHPSLNELWLYESKRRTAAWLEQHHYPCVRTWCFTDEEAALKFIADIKFPLVCKTDQGASSAGVWILRNIKEALKSIKLAFGKGLALKWRDPNVRHQGYVILQEYIPEFDELRIIRVGQSLFCRQKIKEGDFHSGSGKIIWAKPPRDLLNWFYSFTERHNMDSVCVDFFLLPTGGFLINEIHALWGGADVHDSQLEGRYYRDKDGVWFFEPGDWFRNRCANLRIATALGVDKEYKGLPVEW